MPDGTNFHLNKRPGLNYSFFKSVKPGSDIAQALYEMEDITVENGQYVYIDKAAIIEQLKAKIKKYFEDMGYLVADSHMETLDNLAEGKDGIMEDLFRNVFDDTLIPFPVDHPAYGEYRNRNNYTETEAEEYRVEFAQFNNALDRLFLNTFIDITKRRNSNGFQIDKKSMSQAIDGLRRGWGFDTVIKSAFHFDTQNQQDDCVAYHARDLCVNDREIVVIPRKFNL